MTNRVTVILEADHRPDEGLRRTEVSATYDTPHYTLHQVLRVMEEALRGSGFAVGIESLTADRPEGEP